jgi:hypothetical protein
MSVVITQLYVLFLRLHMRHSRTTLPGWIKICLENSGSARTAFTSPRRYTGWRQKRKLSGAEEGQSIGGLLDKHFLKTKLKIFKSQKSKGKYFEDADLTSITCVKLKTKN